jgi:hypothetical protein
MNNDDNLPRIHLNVMEELVAEEVAKQLKPYSAKEVVYIDRVEVATYALNRLPPLYASSQKGKHQQQLSGRQQYREQIQNAVRRGIAAVQLDPLRSSIPIVSQTEVEYREAENALRQLQKLFEEQFENYQALSWRNLAEVVGKVLNKGWTSRAHLSITPPESSTDRAWHDYREHRPARSSHLTERG